MVDENGEIVVPFLRTPFNYDADAVSLATGLACRDESLAVQSARDETDINTIVERFGLTGQLPSDLKVPLDGNYLDVIDYQSAMNVVRSAQETFMELPADVRSRFANDPQRLYEFVQDRGNLEEARRLGIALPEPAPVMPEPVLVRMVPEAPGNSST